MILVFPTGHIPQVTKQVTIQTKKAASSGILIIIIIRLQSSRPQVSSSDGRLGPFPTADYHLASYQDPQKDSEYHWRTRLSVNRSCSLRWCYLQSHVSLELHKQQNMHLEHHSTTLVDDSRKLRAVQLGVVLEL